MAINTLNDKKITQDRYKERVNDFFQRIRNWLPDIGLAASEFQEHTIRDATGEYAVGMLGIHKKGNKDKLAGNCVAELFPQGATALIGEGVLKISSPMGDETLIYLCKNTLPQVEYTTDKKDPLYKGVKQDDWYWLESSLSNRAIPVTKELLFDLVRMVSLYDIDE